MAAVFRAWRAAAADRRLWQHVDFSALYDPGTARRVSPRNLLRSTLSGVLETLDATPLSSYALDLKELLALHGATLRVLRLPGPYGLFVARKPRELRELLFFSGFYFT